MEKKEIVLVDRFQAKDENGSVHTVIIYQPFTISETESGTTTRVPSQKKL
jgi:hypothetical protein